MDLLMTRQFNGVTLDCYRNNLKTIFGQLVSKLAGCSNMSTRMIP